MKLSQVLSQLLIEYFDGLFIPIGYGMTVVTTIFFASITGTIWQLASHWWQILILKG